MTKLKHGFTREDVLKFISDSASFGNLGLFIGAGFCKAVLNRNGNEIALSWGELLGKAAEKLDVDYASIDKNGASFPEIASRVCRQHALEKKKELKESANLLKKEIANITCWYPDSETRKQFGNYLISLEPTWIITTNYDLIIEGLLPGKTNPFGPSDYLSFPRGIIPVYHLHGIRTNPEKIIITQEDYVSLFRPTEYRQIKLALTVKESTTLLIGYGLGDVNVLTAIDWSQNVFSRIEPDFPQEVIQIVRSENPQETPYRTDSGIIVIETNELANFFEEFIQVRSAEKIREEKLNDSLHKWTEAFSDPGQELVERFIDDEEFRRDTIKLLSTFPTHLVSGFISYLDKCIDETWKRSSPFGAFEGYNQNLTIILDILTGMKLEKIPPALFQTAVFGLDRVGYYVGFNRETGKSWSAGKTWIERKSELSQEMISELKNMAEQHLYFSLMKLLKTL